MVQTRILTADGTPVGVDENAVERALIAQRMAQSNKRREKPKPKSRKLVKVVCTTENGPWVDLAYDDEMGLSSEKRHLDRNDDDVIVERGPLEHNEVVEVQEWIADLLVAHKHAVRI